MDIKELPQDKSAIENYFHDVCYVKNSKGKYQTELSIGWDVKKSALDNAWEEIEELVKDAKKAVEEGKKSPIFYFMHLKIMDIAILSGYTGFWKFSIKRHLKPGVFKKLSNKKLQIYADAFNITVNELKRLQV
ncbi:MAG: hypothetical protein ABFS35_05740 [Bacteroidota bacterium]